VSDDTKQECCAHESKLPRLGSFISEGGGFPHSQITERNTGMTAADVLIETLIDWGVVPGDGINGLMESLRTHKDQIGFV
jgi:hypothetical protein